MTIVAVDYPASLPDSEVLAFARDDSPHPLEDGEGCVDCLVKVAPTFPTCEALGWHPIEEAVNQSLSR